MAKSKKVRRGREVYERLLGERDREGLTWVALSERSGVPISTLQKWALRLRADSQPAFVEVGNVEISPTLFEIDLAGGRRVRVPMRFDPDALRALVNVLDAAC
jgi:hypothetical protein